MKYLKKLLKLLRGEEKRKQSQVQLAQFRRTPRRTSLSSAGLMGAVGGSSAFTPVRGLTDQQIRTPGRGSPMQFPLPNYTDQQLLKPGFLMETTLYSKEMSQALQRKVEQAKKRDRAKKKAEGKKIQGELHFDKLFKEETPRSAGGGVGDVLPKLFHFDDVKEAAKKRGMKVKAIQKEEQKQTIGHRPLRRYRGRTPEQTAEMLSKLFGLRVDPKQGRLWIQKKNKSHETLKGYYMCPIHKEWFEERCSKCISKK